MVAYTKPRQWKKEESKGKEGREIRSSLLILDLKEGKLFVVVRVWYCHMRWISA